MNDFRDFLSYFCYRYGGEKNLDLFKKSKKELIDEYLNEREDYEGGDWIEIGDSLENVGKIVKGKVGYEVFENEKEVRDEEEEVSDWWFMDSNNKEW